MTTNNRIITYSGSHGTGKSTAVYNRVADLKKTFPGKQIGIHVENLTFCPYPINEDTTEESQLWIFTNHIQAELYLLSHFDIVVSDRSIIDCIAYTEAAGFIPLASHMLLIALHHMQRYSEINYHTIDNNNHLYDDGLRTTDIDFQRLIERIMLNNYGQLGYTTDNPQFNLI